MHIVCIFVKDENIGGRRRIGCLQWSIPWLWCQLQKVEISWGARPTTDDIQVYIPLVTSKGPKALLEGHLPTHLWSVDCLVQSNSVQIPGKIRASQDSIQRELWPLEMRKDVTPAESVRSLMFTRHLATGCLWAGGKAWVYSTRSALYGCPWKRGRDASHLSSRRTWLHPSISFAGRELESEIW